MFATPVGGAVLLAVIFTLILLCFIVVVVVDGVRKVFHRPAKRDWRELRIEAYLGEYEQWLDAGMAGDEPEEPNFDRPRGFFVGARYYHWPLALQERKYELWDRRHLMLVAAGDEPSLWLRHRGLVPTSETKARPRVTDVF